MCPETFECNETLYCVPEPPGVKWLVRAVEMIVVSLIGILSLLLAGPLQRNIPQ